MIVRRHSSLGTEDALVDREALSIWLKRSVRTIRHYCTPVACDAKTRRTLYRFSDVQAMNASTPKRNRPLAKDQELMAA